MTDTTTNHRRDAEDAEAFFNSRTEEIIGAAIEVHRSIGPGLLESAYEACLCHELALRNIFFQRQFPLPVTYKNVKLDCGYRIDVLVDNSIPVESSAFSATLR